MNVMKMNLAPLAKPNAGEVSNESSPTGESQGFRLLKFNELVSVGDYVIGKDNGFEPWDGPRGFQAGSFVQPIYRRDGARSQAAKKSNN